MASKWLVLFFSLLSLLVTTMAARELPGTEREDKQGSAVIGGYGGYGGYRGYGGYGGGGGCYRCCDYNGCRCCATAEETARVNALGKPQN